MEQITWPEADLEILESCPVCGSQEFDIAHSRCSDIVFGNAPGLWDVQQCSKCQSGFIDRRPTPETIGRAYSSYYTHESGLPDVRSGQSLKLRILELMRGSYVNRHYGKGSPSLGPLGLLGIQAFPGISATLDRKHRFISFPKKGPARLLDIGCGNGDFLQTAKDSGWEVYGCDPDPSACELAMKYTSHLRQGGSEAWHDKKGFFQAITLNHVVEHLHDPLETFAQCHDMLAPGGLLHIETPNFDAVGRDVYSSYWRGLEVPRHLVLFTWGSLQEALKKSGYSIQRKMVRGNFDKLSRTSAKLEAGYRPNQKVPDGTKLRKPSKEQSEKSARNKVKSEFIGIIAQKA